MGRIRSLRLRIIIFNSLIIFATLCLVVGGIIAGMIYFLNSSGRADMEFFITQTASNLDAKTELMEDILLSVRTNPLLMEQLEHGDGGAAAAVQFRRTVNLYSDKNKDNRSQPFISSVYMLGKNGAVFSTHYEPYLEMQERVLLTQFLFWSAATRKKGFDVEFFTEERVIAAVFSVYTDLMEDVGSLVFVMEKEPLVRLTHSSASYQDGFAVVYNKYNERLLTSGHAGYADKAFWLFSQTRRENPFSGTVVGIPCLLYDKELHMGMNVLIGVPRNRLLTQLLDSAGVYLLIMLAGFVFIIIVSSATVVQLTVPLREIAETIGTLDGEHYDVKLPTYDSREFNDISCKFNEMTARLSYLIRDVYKKQILLRESELKFLQSQMNPHFLFNVLNTISLKARFDGNEEICRMAASFSKLAQASIYRRDREKIPLAEELQLVEFYLYLQSCRFGEKLRYRISVSERALERCLVPKLTVQLIVENAVLHGLEPKTGDGLVTVRVERDGNDILISVADDGVGFAVEDPVITLPLPPSKQTETHNRVGINNVHELIRYFYGADYGLSIRSQRGAGATVCIRLPADTGISCESQNRGGGC